MIAPKKNEDRPQGASLPEAKEMQALVERLQKLIAEYVAPAKSMHLKLKGQDILNVLEQALAQADDPEREAVFDQTPEGFFLGGLYEELVQQPGAILEKVADEEGREQFVPLRREVWQACLKRLAEIVRKGVG